MLQGVDFTARAGEMVGLIGPNGSGKTTLLRILANLRTPEAGTVRYSGKTAAELGSAQARPPGRLPGAGRRGALADARGRARGARPAAASRRRSADRMRAIATPSMRAMAAADVAHLRERTMRQVSGGERMRILLARALAVEGELLLADEPTAALDPLHQLQVMDLLRASVRDGHGVIVVLHDLTLAMRFCDRLVLLAEGGVLVEGSPADVLTDAHLARAYGVDVVRGERDGVPFVLPWVLQSVRQ